MKNYLTIYMQYINGNPKISINLKANHSLKSLTGENRQIMKITSTREKMFGGAFRHAKVG